MDRDALLNVNFLAVPSANSSVITTATTRRVIRIETFNHQSPLVLSTRRRRWRSQQTNFTCLKTRTRSMATRRKTRRLLFPHIRSPIDRIRP